MGVIDELLTNNEDFARRWDRGHLDVHPSRRLGTREIVVIHHTDCGLEKVTDDAFRAELQELSGVAPSFAIESFTHREENLRQSIRRVRSSPFIPHGDGVRGFLYDVDTGRLVEVHP